MYQIQKGLIIQKLDKETVIFDAEKSLLYTLNETAAEIFRMLKKSLDKERFLFYHFIKWTKLGTI
jgi:hypothetical protein